MSYVDSILQPNEQVLATGKMHWIIYVQGLALLVVALAVLFIPLPEDMRFLVQFAAAAIGLLALALLFRAWVEQVTTEIAVTNFRVIQKRGLIRRVTGEMNMDKVESVQVDQTIPGRILNYGTIAVRGTGSGIEGLKHIARPLALRSAIVVR